jgi:hypothetical protein
VIITGVTDIQGFLLWLRTRCPKGLTVQIKGESLKVVPKTADDFPTAVSALSSLDASKGVRFHTFLRPEDTSGQFGFRPKHNTSLQLARLAE